MATQLQPEKTGTVSMSLHKGPLSYSFGLQWVKVAVLALTIAVSGVNAQIPGTTDLCSCSPTVFTFTISYDTTCAENTVVENGGIAETSCIATAVAEDPSDRVPVSIDTMLIIELTENIVIKSTTLEGPFNDGDTVVYNSVSTFRNLTDTYFPSGLQVTLQGLNAENNTLISTWGVEYTNDCNFEPVFEEDAQIGWTVFTSTEPPLQQYCPANDTPTIAPTLGGTTIAPTLEATTIAPTLGATTIAPTLGATTIAPTLGATTIAPTLGGTTIAPTLGGTTIAPTLGATTSAPTSLPPSEAPVVTPTGAPVIAPTDAPVTEAPATTPTEAPLTEAPVTAPTKAPVTAPTKAPVTAPTEAPVTKAPVTTPTEAPVAGPTEAPFTEAPVTGPTEAPVTESPVTNAPISPPKGPGPTPAPAPKETMPPHDMSMSYSMSMSMSFYYGDARMLLKAEALFDFDEDELVEFGRPHVRRER